MRQNGPLQLHPLPLTIELKGKKMKALQTLTTATIALALSAGVNLSSAETMSHDSMVMQHAAIQNRHEGTGVLKAVNSKAGKVQIAHETIVSLNWPAMTMWFTIRGPLPNGVKIGDKVHFELIQSDGKSWIISLMDRT
jgi:Cu(I)/Ag(I) efflux system periplasmic protein CusF